MEKGYCADIPFFKAADQERSLIERGVKAGDIYIEGRGAESFDNLIRAMRGKPGTVCIVGTLRVFAPSRSEMAARVKALRDVGVVVVDKESGLRSDKDGIAMLDAALKKTHGNAKVKSDRKFARRIGAKGGKAKFESMRDGRLAAEIAGPIWRQTKLTIAERLALMPGWTEATARRHLAGNS